MARLFRSGSTPSTAAGLLVAGIAVFLLGGCSQQQAESPPMAFVLFDVSGTHITTSDRERFFSEFSRAIVGPISRGEVQTGEIVAVDLVRSMGTDFATCPIYVVFPPYVPKTGDLRAYRKLLKPMADSLAAQVEELVVKSPAPASTDVMVAVREAEQAFSTAEGTAAPHKTLIFFSDMVEQSGRYDFTTDQLTQTGIRTIVDEERSSGRLPDLTGVAVWVTDAALTPDLGLSEKRVHEVRSFWLQYFGACGADLAQNHYGTQLTSLSRAQAK